MKSFIITSSGGGGHKAASFALQEAIKDKCALEKTESNIKALDIMRSSCSFGKIFGKFCTDFWDDAQKDGNTGIQHNLLKLQPVAEAFFFLSTFFTLLNRLLLAKELPDELISTQPLHLLAICLATLAANKLHYNRDKKIKFVDLYLTDLPTRQAEHYFGSLRRLHSLSRTCFDMMRIHSPMPATEPGQTAAQFWRTYAYLKPQQIVCEDLPTNAEFRKPNKLPLPETPTTLKINLFTREENQLLSSLYSGIDIRKKIANFNIKANDKVGLVMLGSVPEKKAIINYVKSLIAAGREISEAQTENDSNYYFFIACGNQTGNQKLFSKKLKSDSLYKTVCKLIANNKIHPKLKIIPFIGQPIAKTFARSDLSITRSGGMTSAELLALKKRNGDNKRVLIHSSQEDILSTHPEHIRSQLLSKIPLWENGNAEYLMANLDAEITNANLAKEEFADLFRSGSEMKVGSDLRV